MQVVVDTSAIIAVIAGEPERPAIISATEGKELIAPPSVQWEVGNAFSAMLKRSRVTPAEVARALEIYHSIPIRFLEVELDNSLEIAAELGVYAYDAYLLRCAQKYRSPLITLDQSLSSIAQTMKLAVVEVAK